ncbi:MAG: hypothetical protein ACLGSA_12020 [Acidobacteriota bacterium]
MAVLLNIMVLLISVIVFALAQLSLDAGYSVLKYFVSILLLAIALYAYKGDGMVSRVLRRSCLLIFSFLVILLLYHGMGKGDSASSSSLFQYLLPVSFVVFTVVKKQV